MGDIVDLDLRSRQPVSHEDEFNSQLVQDLARFSEGLATEKEIRRRYQFDESTWEAFADNEALVSAVEDEKTRRVRSGQLKRELSQRLVTSAPGVLGEILLAKDANPRHRIDAAKCLDDFSTDKSSEAATAGTRFVIWIDLSGDGVDHVLRFDKSIAITAGDITPNDRDDDVDTNIACTPWGMFAIAKKQGDDGNGEPI